LFNSQILPKTNVDKIMVKICIGLITRGRNRLLRQALGSLKNLKIPSDVEVNFILVDNNFDGNTLSLFEDEKKERQFDWHYVLEERTGIPFARNRVLYEAILLGADYLAFFDDDEIVDHEWLVTLYEGIRIFDCVAVSGMKIYKYPTDYTRLCYMSPEDFLKKIVRHVFNYAQQIICAITGFKVAHVRCKNSTIKIFGKYRTGDECLIAPTSNVMYNLNFLKRHNLKFDERYIYSGGTDAYLSTDIINSGGRIIKINEAITYETVIAARINISWILIESFCHGCTITINEKRRESLYSFIINFIKRILLYSPYCIICFLFAIISLRKQWFVHGLRFMAFSIGSISGLIGIKYNKYKSVKEE